MRKSLIDGLHQIMPFFIIWLASFGYTMLGIPFSPLVVFWLLGIPVMHTWIYRGLASKPHLFDFAPYRDSGIPLVVVFWPIFLISSLSETICFWIGDRVLDDTDEEE